MCVCNIIFTAVGTVKIWNVWWTQMRRDYGSLVNAHTTTHPPTHAVGCFRDYRDWRIPIWLINGYNNSIVYIYIYYI